MPVPNLNLWDLPASTSATVAAFEDTLPKDYCLRLTELGLGIGETVECLRHVPLRGPRVYRIGDSVFSIAEDVARGVMIHAVQSGETRGVQP